MDEKSAEKSIEASALSSLAISIIHIKPWKNPHSELIRIRSHSLFCFLPKREYIHEYILYILYDMKYERVDR